MTFCPSLSKMALLLGLKHSPPMPPCLGQPGGISAVPLSCSGVGSGTYHATAIGDPAVNLLLDRSGVNSPPGGPPYHSSGTFRREKKRLMVKRRGLKGSRMKNED